MVDVNIYQEYFFHTKMRLRDLDLPTYLFGNDDRELSTKQQREIRKRVEHEIMEIFYGRNMPG